MFDKVKERQKKERGGKVDRFRFRRRKSGRMTLLRAAFEENDFEGASPPRKKPLKPFWSDEKKRKNVKDTTWCYVLFFIPATFTKTSSSLIRKKRRVREGRDLIRRPFVLVFFVVVVFFFFGERERGEREVSSSFFFFFLSFSFLRWRRRLKTFSQKKGPSPRQQRREKKWNCLEARDRHRTSISPRSLTSSTITTASPGKETRAVRRTVMRPRSGRCEASYRPRICA